MTRLQEQIIMAFSQNKYNFVVDNISYETLFKKTYAAYLILDLLKLGKKDVVLLSGEVTENWMAAYYACLLKGVDLFILPKQLSYKNFAFYMNRVNVSFAFLSGESLKEIRKHITFRNIPFIKGLFDLDQYRNSVSRMSIANIMFLSANIVESTNNIDMDSNLQAIDKKLNKERHSPLIYTITSGVESDSPKIIAHTHESVLRSATNVSEILDFEEHSYLHPTIETLDRYHTIILLNSFLSGSKLCMSPYSYASHIIYDTSSFMKWWNIAIESKITSKWIFRFLRKLNIAFILNWLYLKILKTEISEKETIVVLNGNLPYQIVKFLAKRDNVIITFGDEENNHAIAYNDLSTKALHKTNCIGYSFPSVSIHSTSEETKIISDHLFEYYVSREDDYSVKPRHDMFITNDNIQVKGTSKIPVLFFNGRRSHRLHNVSYDLFERELKGNRFIKNAIFARYPDDGSIVLLIEPNIEEAEHYNIGYFGLEKIFDDLLATYNNEFGMLANKTIILTDNGIDLTTFDGKNKNLLNI